MVINIIVAAIALIAIAVAVAMTKWLCDVGIRDRYGALTKKGKGGIITIVVAVLVVAICVIGIVCRVVAAKSDGDDKNLVSSTSPTPEVVATPEPEEGEIPDVSGLSKLYLEVRFGMYSRDYLRMCDISMANARTSSTGLHDAFAISLVMEQEWFDEGTFYEKNGIELSKLDYSSLLRDADPKKLQQHLEERLAELAEMSDTELNNFYDGQFIERLIGAPQYLLAYVSSIKDERAVQQNNAPLVARFYSYIARCNEIKREDFSHEFQIKFSSDEDFEIFVTKVYEAETDDELRQNVDMELLDQFLDELEDIPLGIERCLQYKEGYPNDRRYLEVTEEYWDFAAKFCIIKEYMGEGYGVAVMETTHNWISPSFRSDDRILRVVEADYQENVPDKNGKVKYAYEGYWYQCRIKDSQWSNKMYIGVNVTDGRIMRAEASTPIETASPTPPPTSTTPPSTQPPVVTSSPVPQYNWEIKCWDSPNAKLIERVLFGTAPAGFQIPVEPHAHEGYTLVTQAHIVTMPAHDITIFVEYVPVGGPPAETDPPATETEPPNEEEEPTPTPSTSTPTPAPDTSPTPATDGNGNKDPEAEPGHKKDGDEAETGPGGNADNNGANDDGTHSNINTDSSQNVDHANTTNEGGSNTPPQVEGGKKPTTGNGGAETDPTITDQNGGQTDGGNPPPNTSGKDDIKGTEISVIVSDDSNGKVITENQVNGNIAVQETDSSGNTTITITPPENGGHGSDEIVGSIDEDSLLNLFFD